MLGALKGWRTLILQGFVFVASALVLFGVISPADLQGVHDTVATQTTNSTAGITGMLVSAIAMIQRLFSTTALGQKE